MTKSIKPFIPFQIVCSEMFTKALVMRSLIIWFIAQGLVLPLHAQDLYNFIRYPAESGIISNQINSAVQDETGYMWLGSTNGLQRFDGIRFKTFRHDEKNAVSLPSNPVWQLLIDKKKNLWLLMADGKVGIFDTRNFTFKEIVTKFKSPPSPNTALKRLSTDEEGNLFYLISGSEVITYNEKANEFSYAYNFLKQ
ncbi:MAG: ligand-binding sensor domain-containing protein, partial [Flavitalea sp.]